jgi:hypothetical protein
VARGKLLAEGTIEELRTLYNMENRSLEDLFLTLTSEVH